MTTVLECGVCAAKGERHLFDSADKRVTHMEEQHPDFLAKNRPTRVDIMTDGQTPLDMWTYEELSARRAELMAEMNNHSLRVNALQKQIAELTPYLNQTISRTPAHERKLPVIRPFSAETESTDGPTT